MKKKLMLLPKSGLVPSLIILFCIFGFTDKKSNDIDNTLRIVVYKGEDYSSSNSELRKSIRNLKYIRKDDDVSSIIVDEGTVARFYRAPNYTACSFEVVGPYRVPRLNKYNCGCSTINSNGWDNEISSIELHSNSDGRSAGVYGDFGKPSKPFPNNVDSYEIKW